MNANTLLLEVVNTAPLLVGWYWPQLQDTLFGIRPTEIKGIWRWWARAFVAGALYERGLLRADTSNPDIYLRPSRESVDTINCFVGKVLGLGYAGDREAEQSRFRIVVNPRYSLRETHIHSIYSWQRLRLLTIKQRIHGIDIGYRFSIAIEKVRTVHSDAEDTALEIFIAALQLQGLGKGGRKGLGSLDIVNIRPRVPVRGLKELISRIYNNVGRIVDRYIEKCTTRRSKAIEKPTPLPPMPLVSRREVHSGIAMLPKMYAYTLMLIDSTSINTLRSIHNFFLRSERCRVLYKSPVCRDKLRTRYHAWILGLPRQPRRGSGYEIEAQTVTRRASPLMISLHTSRNILGGGIPISLFVSGDWPRKLRWRGAGTRSLNIDAKIILSAYSTLVEEFADYLKALSLSVRVVWP